MKPLKSSLLRKIVSGYRIVSENQAYPKESHKSQSSKLDIEQISEKLKVPVSTIEKIYSEIKNLESSLHKEHAKESDITFFRSKIEDLEETAVNSGVYIIPEITDLITGTKEKVTRLELSSIPERDHVMETEQEILELEREKMNLEEAKKTIMKKYYNRDIDESSIKNIMDNYEQRLVETDVKIKNLKEELTKHGKGDRSQEKGITSQFKLRKPTGIEASTIFTPKTSKTFKLSKIFAFQPKTISGIVPAAREFKITGPTQIFASPTASTEATKVNIASQGFEIPQITKKAIKITSPEAEEESSTISLTYPLIPKSPVKNEPVFAYAEIFWDSNNNRYMYNLVEPKLTEKLKDIYKKVKEMLEQKLDIDFSKLKKIEAKDFLENQIDEILKYFNFILTGTEKKILKYYMNRNFTGLEMIEPLLQDSNIEDVSCDGVGIPLFIFHRNPEIGSVMTNVMFSDTEELDSFIIRLAQLCGKSISVSDPLLDGTLPDGSRIQATLGTDIARRGSNFTIRKFTEEPLTPVHLMKYGTLDTSVLAYLWFVVDYGRSILVSGGTASGKTSLLNVLSLFIRPEKKIVSIEDTAELRLPHPHWVPVVARTAIGEEGKGEVDMFELLRESLRQRPDYIVVGEVRGKEAYILFQQMATGHPSLATIHAENIARLIDRLTTPPISLPAGLISTLDTVVFLARMKYKNKFIRKVTEIVEIVDFNSSTNTPVTNQIYKWNPQNDKFEVINKSISLKKISDLTGVSEKDIRSDIERRMTVLEWMKKSNILDYRDVHRIFSIYYTDPERLLSTIQGAD